MILVQKLIPEQTCVRSLQSPLTWSSSVCLIFMALIVSNTDQLFCRMFLN